MIETLKKYFLFIVTPIVFVAGYIYYLVTRNTELLRRIEQKDLEKTLAETLAKKNEVDKNAQDANRDFDKLYDEWKRKG